MFTKQLVIPYVETSLPSVLKSKPAMAPLISLADVWRRYPLLRQVRERRSPSEMEGCIRSIPQ